MSDPRAVWQNLQGRYVLPDDEVHVWRAPLNWPLDYLDALRGELSADERARADRFRFPADRRRHIIGRGISRILLGHCLGLPPRSVPLHEGRNGKPGLLPGPGRPPLHFNISHSGDFVLIALARRDLGVDLEFIRVNFETATLAERFFSPAERMSLEALPPTLQRIAFFAIWTRKEAYIKAHGDGLSIPLDAFDVTVSPEQEPRLAATRHDATEAERWTLRDLDMGADYRAAVAAEGTGWHLKCWNWTGEPLGSGTRR